MKKLLLLTSFLSIALFSCKKIESNSHNINRNSIKKLSEYELAYKKYKEELKEYNEVTKDRHTNIQKFIEDISGLHSNNLTETQKENVISFINDEKSHESWYERCIFT